MLKWSTRFSENGTKPTEAAYSTEQAAHRGGAEGAKET
jgi:hypothetical protein